MGHALFRALHCAIVSRSRVLAVAGGLLALAVGCNIAPSRSKNDATVAPLGKPGQVVEAKRCNLTVVILNRPQGDPLLNEQVWQAADEQVVEPELRRALQTNGMRLGRLTGELPSPLVELLRAKPPNQPEVQMIANPSGDSALIDAAQASPRAALDLLLSDPQGQVRGKNYSDAKGFLRVTATHDGPGAVSVRLTPELHHGPVQAGFGALAQGGVMAPREFQLTSGQKEESFKELAANVSLQPGQVLLIGSRSDRLGSLGSVLLDRVEGNSDRVRQCLILIWASRNRTGESTEGTLDLPPALREIGDAELASAVGAENTSTQPAGTPGLEGTDQPTASSEPAGPASAEAMPDPFDSVGGRPANRPVAEESDSSQTR